MINMGTKVLVFAYLAISSLCDTPFSGNERQSPCWEFLESDSSFWFRNALCRFNGSVIKGRQQKWMDWRVNKCNEPKCSNWSVLWKPHAKITTINSYHPQSLVHCKFMWHTQNSNHSMLYHVIYGLCWVRFTIRIITLYINMQNHIHLFTSV